MGCDWFRLRSGQLIEAFVLTDGGAFYEQLTATESDAAPDSAM